jgi:GGDEF domain-containing protein
VAGHRFRDDRPMGEDMAESGSAMGDDGHEDGGSVVDEMTGLANRRGFLEILRMEERRHARYGGEPILVLVDVGQTLAQTSDEERPEQLLQIADIVADAVRDTDTIARVDEDRFAILAIQAGCSASSIVGRLRLQLELRRFALAEVTVGEPGSLVAAWLGLEGSARPQLRIVR